jgi:putative PIN family toxin of toxin-antitoxin system
MGADSVCIKDQAGLISPYDAYELIKALKENLEVPVELHTHYTSGQASMSVLKAIEAGVDIVDTALSPFALRSSQPPIEPLVVALYGTGRDTGLDIEQLFKCGQMIEQVAPKYRDFLDTSAMSVIDTGVLVSAAIRPESVPALAVEKALLYFEVCASDETLADLDSVLTRPKFDSHAAPELRRAFLDGLRTRVRMIDVTQVVTDCPDPKDNKFLELAVAAQADFLVSSDVHLLEMHPFRRVQILQLAHFKSLVFERHVGSGAPPRKS